MQGFRYSLRPLWLFWGVIEEKSLFAEIKFLKTKEKLGVYPSLVLLLSFSCEPPQSIKTIATAFSRQCCFTSGLLCHAAYVRGLHGICLVVWMSKLFCSREMVTYPTQYTSGGLRVQLSQGRRLSFGVCPLTL